MYAGGAQIWAANSDTGSPPNEVEGESRRDADEAHAAEETADAVDRHPNGNDGGLDFADTPTRHWSPAPTDPTTIPRGHHYVSPRSVSTPLLRVRTAAEMKLVSLPDVLPDPFRVLAGWPTAQNFSTGSRSFLSDYVDELPDWISIIAEVMKAPVTRTDHVARYGRLTAEIHEYFRNLESLSQQVEGRRPVSFSRQGSLMSIRTAPRFVSSSALRDAELLSHAASPELNQLVLSFALLCVRLTEAVDASPHAAGAEVTTQVECLAHAASVVSQLVEGADDLIQLAEAYVKVHLHDASASLRRPTGTRVLSSPPSVFGHLEALCEDPAGWYGHLLYLLTLAHPESPSDLGNGTLETAPLDPSVLLSAGQSAALECFAVCTRFSSSARQIEEFRLILHGFMHSSRCYTWARRKISVMKVQSTLNEWSAAEIGTVLRTNKVLLDRIHEGGRCFHEIFVVDSGGHGDAFATPPAVDELHALWQDCVDLQTAISPRSETDQNDAFSKAMLIKNFRRGVARLYSNVVDDCTGRSKANAALVLADDRVAAVTLDQLTSTTDIVRVADSLPRRVDHLTRTLRHSSLHSTFDLAAIVTTGCAEHIAIDAERLLLQYFEGTIEERDTATAPVSPDVHNAPPEDEDVLRVTYALAALFRKWSLGGAACITPAVRLFPSILCRVIDNLQTKHMEWLSTAFQLSEWSETLDMPLVPKSRRASGRFSVGATPVHAVSSTGVSKPPPVVRVPIPSCMVDMLHSISKCSTFVHDAIKLLSLEASDALDDAGRDSDSQSDSLDSCKTRLVEVICMVYKSFMVRVVAACVDDAGIDHTAAYAQFITSVQSLPGDQGAFAHVAKQRTAPTSTGATAASPRHELPSTSMSPLPTVVEAEEDDDLFNVDAFSIASPLRFNEPTRAQELIAATTYHVETKWPYPWDTLALHASPIGSDFQPSTISSPQVPRESADSIPKQHTADLEARIKAIWSRQGATRLDFCARLNTLDACAKSFGALPSFVSQLHGGGGSGATRTRTLDVGLQFAERVAALGRWAYVRRIIECIEATLSRLLSSAPCGTRLRPDQEESFVRDHLRRIGRFLQDEVLQASRVLPPVTHEAFVGALLGELYAIFAQVALRPGGFAPVESSTAHRARRCTLFFIGVFERMQCANVPTKISMQFVELVELFEMFTTPTADLAYLLLHCSHGITRIKGTAVSRVVMSAKSAHERMATLLVHPSTDADRAAPDSNTLIANHRSDFTASLFAMWSSGIVPRLTESFDGIVSALFRCVQVFQLLESGELNKQTHSRQFQLKLHTCVYLGAELLRQCFHRHNIARARGLFWSHPRAFSGTEFCIALVDATKNPPPTAERNAKYGGGRLERLRILKHSADELLGIVVHRHNVVQIDKGSPAERAQVAVGDNLIAVNGRDLRGLDHDEIVAVLQEKGTLRQQVFDLQTVFASGGVSGNDPLNPTEEFLHGGIEIMLVVERKSRNDLRDRPLWQISLSDAIAIGQMLFGVGLLEPITDDASKTEFTNDKQLFRFVMDRKAAVDSVQLSKWNPPANITDPALAQGLVAAVLQTRADKSCTASVLADILAKHSKSHDRVSESH